VRRIVPRRQLPPVATRNAGLLSPALSVTAGGTSYVQPWDAKRGIRDGHDREAVVAAVTTAIARDVADTSRFITRAELLGTGADYSEKSHYAQALNLVPATGLTAAALWQHLTLSLLYTGEAYLLESKKTLTPLVGGTVEILPGARDALNGDGSPQLIAGYRVKNDGGAVVGVYAADGRAVGGGAIPGSILHRVYLPHPENVLRANSPIQQAGLPIDVLHYFRQATRSILLNDGMASGILSVEDPTIDADSLTDLERRLNSRMADPNRKGRILVVDAQTRFEEVGGSPLSRDWVDLARHFRDEVLSVFRAPESILGRGAGMTFENQAVTQRAYISQVLLPIRQLVLDSLNLHARKLGHYLYVDVEAIPELADDEEAVAARAATLYQNGLITLNEARTMIGLSDVADGDRLLTPPPAATVAPAQEPAPAAPEEVERDVPFVGRVEARSIAPDAFSDLLEQTIARHETALASYAQQYHTRLYRNLSGAIRKKADATRADGQPLPPLSADELFNVTLRNTELADDLVAPLTAAADDVARLVAAQLSVDPSNMDDLRWKTLLSDRISRLVEGTTVDGQVAYRGWNAAIHDELLQAMAAAYQAGESVDGAIARVANILGIDPSDPAAVGYRAERIARTELIGLANESARQQMADSGVVTAKRWYSIGDNRTRDSHAALNGTTVAFDATFDVGGHPAQGPHDWSLPAEEVINCRCRLIPVVGEM
jgi:HK97 family phage portal protein